MGTKLGNVTMTDDKLIISYSKNVTQQRPSNFIGVDRNLDNVTTCDSQGKYVVHDLSKIQKIITSYSTVKSRFRRNDSRIRQKIFQKYGRLQKNRVHNILHHESKKIVSQNCGIMMEDLKGLRRLQKGKWSRKKIPKKDELLVIL